MTFGLVKNTSRRLGSTRFTGSSRGRGGRGRGGSSNNNNAPGRNLIAEKIAGTALTLDDIATAQNMEFDEIKKRDEIDAKMGFARFTDGPERIGWLVNMTEVGSHWHRSRRMT